MEPIGDDVVSTVGQAWEKSESLYDKKQALFGWVNDTFVSQVNEPGEYLGIYSLPAGKQRQIEVFFEVEASTGGPALKNTTLAFPRSLVEPETSVAETVSVTFDRFGIVEYPHKATDEEKWELEKTLAKLADAVMPDVQEDGEFPE